MFTGKVYFECLRNAGFSFLVGNNLFGKEVDFESVRIFFVSSKRLIVDV